VNRKAAVDAIFSRRLWFYSFRKQAAAAIVQQISAAVGQQVPSAARRDLAGRTRERRSLDNQPREPNCAAPPDTFVNTMPGPYVPGGRVEALAFTLSVIVTPVG
jgi:hypothetical protein